MDPFQPPKSDIDTGAHVEVPIEPARMPGVVIGATVVVAVLALISAAELLFAFSFKAGASIVISALIIVGMLRRHALAWQWGIVIPTLYALATVIALAAVVGAFDANPALTATLGTLFALYVSLPILLSMRAARIYFGLKCPRCAAVKGRAASFLFSKRRCAECKFTWTPVSRAAGAARADA